MDKMNETLPSSSREMRNRAEKQRRDKLNAYISELYSLVPSAAAAPRKLDKTSTLRLSANFLRIHQNVDLRMKPYNRWNAIAGHTILEKLDSFLLVVSCCSGKIIYVTDRVEKLLGHAQVDMMGYQLSCFVHHQDQDAIEKRLSAFATQVAANPDAKESLDGQVYSFECRLAGRQLSRGEPTVYERVSVSGTFRGPRRRRDWADRYLKSNDRSVAAIQQHNDYSEPLFIGLVRILQTANTLPPLTIMQAVQDEYVTQHTTTGTIMQTDHRIAIIAGYLTGEVTGMSAYDYVYKEDLEYTLKAQSLMLSRSEGMVTYRLRTSTGRLIFLRSRGFIQYDENTKEIISFFCINSLIDEEQGMKEMQEMRAMLDKLNIGPVTPSIASSPTNSIEPAAAPSLEAASRSCVSAAMTERKPSPSAPTNGCHVANGTRVMPRLSGPPNGLCISPPASELQYSPSESSSSSFSIEDRCQSTTPHSSVSPPVEIPNLVAVSYPSFATIPFQWRPEVSTIAATPNGLVSLKETTIKSPEIGQANPILGSGSLAVSLDHQWDPGHQVPNSQSIVIQHNGAPSHLQSLAPVATINAHSLQSSTSDNVEPLRSMLNQPSAVSPIGQAPLRQQEDPLQISTPEHNTSELNRNNCINGYIIWPRKMSPKTHKDNLILNYLDSEKHAYKQSEITGTDYYHAGELKVNTGTNSA